ncbi:MAG: TetR/AcrR family transcriptional regulator [Bifidobacteriaceae bacterium]|jgi:AcrR family transcriptional regulator|nr:TetR/AcrR family transcriptional regulator [Bifidobacteriaceae bacterium]
MAEVPAEGGKRGPYRTGLRTRDQIIAAASAAFAERGYHGSSLRQIAAAIGLSPAAILRHFDSKDDLLTAVLEDWTAQTNAIQGQPRPRGLAFWAGQRTVMEFHTRHLGLLALFIVLAGEATAPDHPANPFMVPRYEAVARGYADALLEAAADGEIAPLTSADALREARHLVAFMDGIEVQALLNPDVDLVAEMEAYLSQTLTRLGGTYVPPQA